MEGRCLGPPGRVPAEARGSRWGTGLAGGDPPSSRREGGGWTEALSPPTIPPPPEVDPGFVSSPDGRHASPEKARRVLWPRGLGYLRITLGEGHRVESLHACLYVLST